MKTKYLLHDGKESFNFKRHLKEKEKENGLFFDEIRISGNKTLV